MCACFRGGGSAAASGSTWLAVLGCVMHGGLGVGVGKPCTLAGPYAGAESLSLFIAGGRGPLLSLKHLNLS